MAFASAGAVGGKPGSPIPVGAVSTRHNVNFNQRSLFHGKRREAVEVALHGAAILHRDLALHRRCQAVNNGAFNLGADAVRIQRERRYRQRKRSGLL